MTSTRPPVRDAAYFDQWYADMAASPARDAIMGRTMGLPPEMRFASAMPWAGVLEMTEALALPPGGLLLDIACGRGGYGIEIARRTGARLVGVDFSAVALEQARSISAGRLPAGRAEFQVGTLTATGLPTGVADGVICVDGVQFASPPLDALREFRRLLKPGGRLALTSWEAVEPADERVGPRIRAVDLRRDLPSAGFVDVSVREMPEWRAAERAMFDEALAVADPDAAVRSLQNEGRRSLEAWDALRRVFATATS